MKLDALVLDHVPCTAKRSSLSWDEIDNCGRVG